MGPDEKKHNCSHKSLFLLYANCHLNAPMFYPLQFSHAVLMACIINLISASGLLLQFSTLVKYLNPFFFFVFEIYFG